jgi:flagellin
MSRINTNVAALIGLRHLAQNNDELSLRLERLSTGLQINRGRDDPAGLIASEELRAEIRVIQQAVENSSRAANVVRTAEGALHEVSALLLDLQSLIVQTANEGGLTEDEIHANQLQIDSILASIDRIANTTTFGEKKLLDGSGAYLTSGVLPAAMDSVALYSTLIPPGGSRSVSVTVTQSAQTAKVAFIGSKANALSTTSAVAVEIRGTLGMEVFSFASGTSLAGIRAAINNLTAAIGVSAVVSTPTAGSVRSALVLNSTAFGSDAFVSVSPIAGNFVVAGNYGTITRDAGRDAGVIVDGHVAAVNGLRADVRVPTLDARIYLNKTFAQRLSSATFTITGGGSIFQITPEISPNGQVAVGFNSVSTTQLGNAVSGLLYTLRSGHANELGAKRFDVAQQILKEATDQVSFYRGRLGGIHKDQIEPNINSQNVTLENITASESVIRDADMAVEVSQLTRAQILVQATQSTLQIANNLPRQVLALLV